MPDPAIVIPLLLAALVALAIVLFVRRASGALRETRQVERFQAESAALGMRLDVLLAATISRVDAVRRHELPPADAVPDLESAIAQLDAALGDAEALDPPDGFASSRHGVIAEIRHAQRALDMVLHGCDVISGPRARSRYPESQISVKRGYLNLLHAREALARHAADLAAARDAAQSAWRTSRI